MMNELENEFPELNNTSGVIDINEVQEGDELFALLTLAFLFCSQFGVLAWKKYHPSSFQTVTLIGLWIVPPVIGVLLKNYRYVVICTLFGIASFFMYRKSQERPLKPETPRTLYTWFAIVHKITYFMGASGYIVFLLGMFITGQTKVLEIGLYIAFYGIYFGILNKDTVDELSSRMALNAGYIQKQGIPTKNLSGNVCSICGGHVREGEPSCKLDCGHMYHEYCIRGWIIIGKKATCPYCKEKVETNDLANNPWNKIDIMYSNVLDFFRYLLVWQPLIITIVEVFSRVYTKDQPIDTTTTNI